MKTFLNAGHDDRAAEVKFYFYDACRVKNLDHCKQQRILNEDSFRGWLMILWRPGPGHRGSSRLRPS